MTKEELKREAEEWLCNNLHSASEEDFIKAMVDIAEPREKLLQEKDKKIAELVSKNYKLEYQKENLENKIEHHQEVITTLQKKIAELKADNDARKFAMAMSEKVEKQLREENAELKLKLEALDGQTPWKDIKDKSEVIGKLTNAKELLKNILAISVHDKRQCTYDAYILTVKEAEQFLKDSEVEK